MQNTLPPKDIVKVSFILEPFQNLLPSISSDGYLPFSIPFEQAAKANSKLSNNRLNANRMLRARKILGYVAERIEAPPTKEEAEDEGRLKPEEYLELWCHGQVCFYLRWCLEACYDADMCEAYSANYDLGLSSSSRLAWWRRRPTLLQGQWPQGDQAACTSPWSPFHAAWTIV